MGHKKNKVQLRALYRKGLSYFDLLETRAGNDWREAAEDYVPAGTTNPLGTHVKSKCCRSNPRCIACPVVHRRLALTGDYSAESIRLARRW